jgi:hypothetical protein
MTLGIQILAWDRHNNIAGLKLFERLNPDNP